MHKTFQKLIFQFQNGFLDIFEFRESVILVISTWSIQIVDLTAVTSVSFAAKFDHFVKTSWSGESWMSAFVILQLTQKHKKLSHLQT